MPASSGCVFSNLTALPRATPSPADSPRPSPACSPRPIVQLTGTLLPEMGSLTKLEWLRVFGERWEYWQHMSQPGRGPPAA